MAKKFGFALLLRVFAGLGSAANGAELKVLTAGAFMQVIEALIPDFEKETGHKVTVEKDTAGGLKKRIAGGEAFDVAVITPVVIEALAKTAS